MLIKAVETAFGLKCKRRMDDMAKPAKANQLFAHDKHRKYDHFFQFKSQFRELYAVILLCEK